MTTKRQGIKAPQPAAAMMMMIMMMAVMMVEMAMMTEMTGI